MGFDIEIDYAFDRSGFFDPPGARAAMEAAAEIWEDLIGDEFAAVPAGVSFSLRDPETRNDARRVTLERPIEDLRIFVGAADLGPSTLALAGPSGFDAVGDPLQARISGSFRDLGPATDFEPFAGSISFSRTADWSFAIDAPEPGRSDFLTTALHEIAHVLGVATSAAFNIQRGSEGFAGVNARAANGGAPVPLSLDGHVADGFGDGGVLLDPTNESGARKLPGEIDKALLADIGYEIAGFARQGTRFPVATEGSETIFGTDGADALDGLSGADQVQGGAGADTLSGGPGEDTLFGGAGADVFRIAPGAGVERVADFEPGRDTILLAGDFGLASAEVALDRGAMAVPGSTVLDLGAGTILSVVVQGGAALTPGDLRLEGADEPVAPLTGTAGADTLSGTGGADRIAGLGGDDTVIASPGADRIEGGAGTDRVLYAAERADLAPLRADDGTLRVAAPGGTDTLAGVERIGFEGGAFLYDLAAESEALGTAYRLFAAAFDRVPREAGLVYWADRLGEGMAPRAVASAFAGSAEFAGRYGADPAAGAYVTALYENVLKRQPAEEGLAFWTGAFASGARDRADMLLAFAESPENVARTAPDLDNGIYVLAETDPLLL